MKLEEEFIEINLPLQPRPTSSMKVWIVSDELHEKWKGQEVQIIELEKEVAYWKAEAKLYHSQLFEEDAPEEQTRP